MAFGVGEGGARNAPLGRSVMGGLLVATFLTVVIVPLIYSVLRAGESHAASARERAAQDGPVLSPAA